MPGGGLANFVVNIPDTPTTIWELHGELRTHGLHLRGLFTMAHVNENGMLTRALGPVALGGTGDLAPGEGIGGELLGAYGEIAYDVLPLLFPDTTMSLEPFFRFEYLDTQRDLPSGFKIDESKIFRIFTTGFSFEPIPNVAVKLDWRRWDPDAGQVTDELNMGVGFAF
jgi:hypothetical protein